MTGLGASLNVKCIPSLSLITVLDGACYIWYYSVRCLVWRIIKTHLSLGRNMRTLRYTLSVLPKDNLGVGWGIHLWPHASYIIITHNRCNFSAYVCNSYLVPQKKERAYFAIRVTVNG